MQVCGKRVRAESNLTPSGKTEVRLIVIKTGQVLAITTGLDFRSALTRARIAARRAIEGARRAAVRRPTAPA